MKHNTSTSNNPNALEHFDSLPDSANVRLPVVEGLYGYMRQKELLTLLPFSPATLWRKVKAGSFVRPVKLSARITAWPRIQVYAWLQEQEVRK